MTKQTTPALDELFDGGPPRRLETAVRLVTSDNRNTIPRAVLISMIVWALLVLLAAMQSFALGDDKLTDLLLDFVVHACYLVAVRCSLWRSLLPSRGRAVVIIAALLPFVPVLLYEILLNVILPDLVKLLL